MDNLLIDCYEDSGQRMKIQINKIDSIISRFNEAIDNLEALAGDRKTFIDKAYYRPAIKSEAIILEHSDAQFELETVNQNFYRVNKENSNRKKTIK